MATRNVDVTIIVAGHGGRQHVSFTLTCHADAQIIPGLIFEIVSPGCESVRAQPIMGQVVNRSDGTASARMVGDQNVAFSVLVARLQKMPNVSNIEVG